MSFIEFKRDQSRLTEPIAKKRTETYFALAFFKFSASSWASANAALNLDLAADKAASFAEFTSSISFRRRAHSASRFLATSTCRMKNRKYEKLSWLIKCGFLLAMPEKSLDTPVIYVYSNNQSYLCVLSRPLIIPMLKGTLISKSVEFQIPKLPLCLNLPLFSQKVCVRSFLIAPPQCPPKHHANLPEHE